MARSAPARRCVSRCGGSRQTHAALVAVGWRVAGPARRQAGNSQQPVRVYPGYSLDWHAFSVPAGASGQAALWLEFDGMDAQKLATLYD